ncbi:MAG: hypothetical protein HY535_08140 [Chloroflexi bacterium]|nr:hypothetical protein [Chloroflexota bacterium]
MNYGLTVKHHRGGKRLELQCSHHNGLLYVVPAEGSWVCGEEHVHAHALAGFFKELAALRDPRVKELMRRWGLSFRERPLEQEATGAAPSLPEQSR